MEICGDYSPFSVAAGHLVVYHSAAAADCDSLTCGGAEMVWPFVGQHPVLHVLQDSSYSPVAVESVHVVQTWIPIDPCDDHGTVNDPHVGLPIHCDS